MTTTTTVHAFAAPAPGKPLEPFTYTLGPIGDDEVDIDVEHCGICHSDLSMLKNDWGMTVYPFVPGHEVAGRIRAIGARVQHLNIGDRVGLGWHAGYCLHCRQCLSGDHNMCATAQATIVGRHGGFADIVRAQATSVVQLPAAISPRTVGPMFCGGITVFNPLVQSQLSPTAQVAVIGIGGLGHLALKFARAWGCHVTAFTSSESKQQEALELGAHETINSRDFDAITRASGRFDLIISTVNVPLDWNAYIQTLAPRGRLHMVGAVLEPLDLATFPLIMAQRSVSGSPVGAPATIRTMLEFAARHRIEPRTEHFPLARVNDALAHLESGRARYRIVLDNG